MIKSFWKFTLIRNHDIVYLAFGRKQLFHYQKDWFRVGKHKLKRRLKSGFIWLVDVVSQREIYGWYSATDCDHYHVEYAIKYDNRKAWDDALYCLYDDAEGPTSLWRMTKQEYLDNVNERVSRDYVAEAHENGHPYNVEG